MPGKRARRKYQLPCNEKREERQLPCVCIASIKILPVAVIQTDFCRNGGCSLLVGGRGGLGKDPRGAIPR
jgi:hypothetical protein